MCEILSRSAAKLLFEQERDRRNIVKMADLFLERNQFESGVVFPAMRVLHTRLPLRGRFCCTGGRITLLEQVRPFFLGRLRQRR